MKPRLLLMLALLVSLGGCSDDRWQTTPIHGLMPELAFTLVDENDDTVTAEAYAGKVRLVFFGFSHCRKACPMTLGKLSLALEQVGRAAADTRVLFVSVDPARDTPAVLRDYTDNFTSRMIGLTGSHSQLQELAKRYRVAYSYGAGYPGEEYRVFHSSAVFVFDRRGEIRLIFQADDSLDAITHDLRQLLQEQRFSAGEGDNKKTPHMAAR